MSDDRLVAGDPTAARCAAPDSCFAGAVHAYRMVGGAWVLQQTVVPPDATYGDRFGYHVDLDGDRMIVGSVFAQLAGFSAGAAYFYEFDGGEWVETARVAPPEPIAWSDFGSTVAIEGALAAVTQRQGVYVFEQVAPGQWAWSDTLTPPDGVPLTAAFGAELLLTSEWLFVGAPFDRTLGPNGGAVYVYRRSGVDLTFAQKIEPVDPSIHPRLGTSIAFDGASLFVGGPIADGLFEFQGFVYRYVLEGEQWVLRQEITMDPPVDDANFGRDLAVAGDALIVGADDETTTTGEGAAYIIRQQAAGDWCQTARVVPPTSSFQFGWAAAGNDESFAISAISEREGMNTGVVYAFDLDCLVCPPDLDADGTLTVFDFLTFLNLFDAGDATADFDGDGELTIFDFLAFQNQFDAGC